MLHLLSRVAIVEIPIVFHLLDRSVTIGSGNVLGLDGSGFERTAVAHSIAVPVQKTQHIFESHQKNIVIENPDFDNSKNCDYASLFLPSWNLNARKRQSWRDMIVQLDFDTSSH